jgi:hypothetical protein
MAEGSAQYVIDIAALMPNGEALAADLDRIAEKLTTAGVSADQMSDAVAMAANALGQASAASKHANEALADGNKLYKDLEQAANQAAKAQEKAALLGVVPPEVDASVVAATKALDEHTVALKKLETEAAQAANKEAALTAQLKHVKTITSDSTRAHAAHERGLKKLAGAFNTLGGPIGAAGYAAINLTDDFGDMTRVIGKGHAVALVAAAGFVALVVAIVAVSVAAVAGVAAVAAWGVGLANSKRDADLTSEAMQALHPELKALSGTIAAVAKETGLHSDELQELAGKLKAAKVAAADMPDALRAAALAEAALGAGGSADFIEQLKAGKRAAGALSKEVAGKLSPIVAEKMRGLGAQSQRFHDLIGNLFGGLNIEPLLTGLTRLINLFDETTAAGKAIRLIFERVFQPLIDSADKAAIMIEAFALGVIIGVLKMYIALKPTIQALSEFFGLDDMTTADTLASITRAGEALVPVLAFIAAQFLIMIAVVAAVAASLALPLVAMVKLVEYLKSLSFQEIGVLLIRGLAAGITLGGSEVLIAITRVIGSAISAASRLLDSHSPSKVFADLGYGTGEGYAEGVDDSAPMATRAVEDMVAPPNAGTGTAPRGGGAGASRSIDLTGAHFTFNGVANAEQAAQLFQEMLTRFFEGTADSIGGPEAAPA